MTDLHHRVPSSGPHLIRMGWWLAALSVAVGVVCLLCGVGELQGEAAARWMYIGPDTGSYYADGISRRPPLYPFLLHSADALFGKSALLALALLQILLWGLAVAAMWRMAIPLAGRWGILAAAFFALWPPLTIWTLAVYVESVAICGMVFSALCLFMWLQSPVGMRRTLWMVLFILSLGLLLLIRPAFAYVAVATLVTALVALCVRSPRWKPLAVAALCGLMAVGAYSLIVYWRIGVFAPSCVGIDNNYYMARRAGVINPAFNPDSAQRAFIAEHFPSIGVAGPVDADTVRIWRECFQISCVNTSGIREQTLPLWRLTEVAGQDLPYTNINTMLRRSIAANSGAYWRSVAEYALRGLTSQPLISAGNDWPSTKFAPPVQHWGGRMQMRLGLTLGSGALFLLLVLIAIPTVPLRHEKRTDGSLTASRLRTRLFILWLCICCLGNLATVLLGAPYDHSRLFVESVPLVLLIASAALHGISRVMRRPVSGR